MSTQKHNTLNAQGAIKAPVVAGRTVGGKADKLATKAELDKLAKADIEQEVILAEADTQAPVELAMAEGTDAPLPSSIGAVEGAAAEGAAAPSPLMIGAGVVAGVAAVAALASGGGSSSSSNDNIQQKPPVDNNKKPDAGNPDKDTETPNTQPPAGGNDNTTPPAGGGNDNTKPQVPAGPAQAGGSNDKPTVAIDGVTTLKKESFELSKADGSPVEYVKITRIDARQDSDENRTRLVRYGQSTGEDNSSDAQGIDVARKAPAAAVDPAKAATAYEVITPDQPVTLAEAKAMAEKLGGKLLVVDDAAEAQWLQNTFKFQLGQHTAWIGGKADAAGANVAKAVGENPATAQLNYETVAGADAKQPAFIIEYANYQQPLMLDGKPVEEGQIIARADLDKLSWNGDLNTNAFIKIVAVDSDDPVTAKEIEGADGKAITREINLTESADIKPPMVQPPAPQPGDSTDNGTGGAGGNTGGQGSGSTGGSNQPQTPETHEHDAQSVNHNAASTAIPDGVLGLGAGNDKAEYIKILDIHSQETENGKRVVNWHENVEGKKPTAYELVKTDKPLTLEEAKAMAEKLGGKLLVINDDAEAAWLKPQLGVEADTYHFEDARQPSVAGKATTKEVSEVPAGSTVSSTDTVERTDTTSSTSPTQQGGPTAAAQASGTKAAEEGQDPSKDQLTETQDGEQKEPASTSGEESAGGPGSPSGVPEASGSGGAKAEETEGSKKTEAESLPKKPEATGESDGSSVNGSQQPASPPAGQADDQEPAPKQDTADKDDAQEDSQNAGGAGASQPPADSASGAEEVAPPKKLSAFVIEYENYESPLKLNGTSVKPGAAIHKNDFGNLSWDSTQNSGGGFKYVAASDDKGTEVPGAVRQYVPVKEAAAPVVPPAAEVPTYGDALTANVEHDKADFNFSAHKAHFEGTGNTKATHIKISEIKNGAGDAAAAEGTLKYEGTAVNATTVIDLTKLNLLVWDASLAEGGSFKFTAVQANGDPIAQGPAAQSVTINEAAAPVVEPPKVPSYGDEALVSTVASHNKADHSFASMKEAFEGTGDTKATYIKITEIKNGTPGAPNAEEDTLKYENNNVTSDMVIDLAKLDQLVWDASKAVGGSFKFTAVQQSGDPIVGGPGAQTVTINEPLHTPTPEQKEVVKNDVTPLGKDLFDSSVEGNTDPKFIKITAITPKADELASQHVINTEGNTAYQVVKVEAGITLEQAKVAAREMGGTLLEISSEDELTQIKGHATLLEKLGKLGEGSDDIKKGAWFLNPSEGAAAEAKNSEGIYADGTLKFVSDAEASDTKLNGYIVEFNRYSIQKAGLLVGDQGSSKAVSVNDVLDTTEMSKLSWDSVFNNGGEVKFIEVTAKQDGQNAPGAVENTLTITESSATAALNSVLQNHEIL